MEFDNTDYFKVIYDSCLSYFREKTDKAAMDMAVEIMSGEGFPMHRPEHHFLVPAVLLTTAAVKSGMDEDTFVMKLNKAKTRGKTIPGAVCGEFGACGAGIGAGIFAAIWLDTTPYVKEELSTVGTFTADALAEIASFPGPRCCKRVSFIGIESGVRDANRLLDMDLTEVPVTCSFFKGNSDCIGVKCRFFPKHK